METTPILKAERLTKRFGPRLAVDRLDLSVAAGQIHCLLGSNGAGKTTTIHLFAGFLEPTAGAAYVRGRDTTRHRREIRADLAYVPEQVSLYPLLTGLENLVFFTRLAGLPVTDPTHLRKWFAQVGLDPRVAEERVDTYSKGMRQKTGLAIALAKGARAFLLDEPLSGLDPRAANEFCALLRHLAADGAAILMATHDLFRAKEVGHRVGIMKAGRLVEDVETAQLDHARLEHIYLEHVRDTCVPGEAS